MKQPRIICLCGSTKFKKEYEQMNRRFTLKGYIVLSVGFFGHSDEVQPTDEEKRKLDELHKRKIDLADEVFIINLGGYIGESTRDEISYSRAHNKPISFYY